MTARELGTRWIEMCGDYSLLTVANALNILREHVERLSASAAARGRSGLGAASISRSHAPPSVPYNGTLALSNHSRPITVPSHGPTHHPHDPMRPMDTASINTPRSVGHVCSESSERKSPHIP